ncbi:MAG: TetR/AcrR family transcriptional regulator [Anaerolineae bacterium]
MSDSVQDRPVSRRERLKREREERILDAATAVFAEKGFHQATIRDIAQLADVADGTIYNYFDDKFDLLIGIMSRIAEVEQLPEELRDALEGSARDFFVTAFCHRLGRIEQSEEMLRAILPQVLINPELRERFYQQYVLRVAALLEQFVRGQVERGRIRPVNVPLATRLVQGIFVGILFMRILGDEQLHSGWEEVPELLATMIFDGLSPGEKG